MKEDNVGVVNLDELKEIGEDNLLRPLEPCSRSLRAWMHEISLGKFGSPATTSIPMMLKGTWKSERTWTRPYLHKGNRSFSARYRGSCRTPGRGFNIPFWINVVSLIRDTCSGSVARHFFRHGCGRSGHRLNFSFPQASGEYETASNLPDLVEEL